MQSYVQRRSFELSTAALPGCLKECQLDLSPLDSSTAELEKETSLNKIFACAWAEDRVLLAGTKDNKIVRWHFNRDFSVKQREIMCMPDSAPQHLPIGQWDNGTTAFTPKGGQYAIKFNRVFGGSDIAVGGNGDVEGPGHRVEAEVAREGVVVAEGGGPSVLALGVQGLEDVFRVCRVHPGGR